MVLGCRQLHIETLDTAPSPQHKGMEEDALSSSSSMEVVEEQKENEMEIVNLEDKVEAPKIGMTFGVNHHGHSILLRCGLISNEDTDTFTWLFQTWLTCMSGCATSGIITDQDKAMKKAIEKDFEKFKSMGIGHIEGPTAYNVADITGTQDSIVVNMPVNILYVSFPSYAHSQAFNAPDDLPKTVAWTLNQGSTSISMDFHPLQQTLLLVYILHFLLNLIILVGIIGSGMGCHGGDVQKASLAERAQAQGCYDEHGCNHRCLGIVQAEANR
ncbi:hypothetical protein F0562_034195 [Nyssa sinensis]|uniref:Protein FAR1-RELATED SEQUENCE n=1 Tax=Nyssa sinensis TaxID=561372 RepID=A0A5J5AF56_9ASTE|nr:hypothetical protein F0562_034195 [Nyssa sinensis]